jgi:hypothetical protein
MVVPTAAIKDLQYKMVSLESRIALIEAMLSLKETRQPPDLSPVAGEVNITTHEIPKQRRRRRTKAEIEADIDLAFLSARKGSGYKDLSKQDEPEDTGDIENADQP